MKEVEEVGKKLSRGGKNKMSVQVIDMQTERREKGFKGVATTTSIAMEGEPFTLYERLNWVLTSCKLYADTDKKGNVKKAYKPIGKWQSEDTRILQPNTDYAVLTGIKSGITVIDIDDPTLTHNEQLMDLMTECNMVAKTKKGYHYVFKYNPSITTTTSKPLALDTRNDDAILFIAPSNLMHNGNAIASYEWEKQPFDDEPLTDMPQEVIDFLQKLDQRYVKQEVTESDNEVEQEREETITIPTVESSDDPLLVKVVNALPQSIIENYQDWLNIGIIFYNEKLTVENWDAVSRRASNYADGICRSKWGSFKERKGKLLTKATLWHLLKKNNPSMFYELLEQRKDFLDMLDLINHNDVAKDFYNLYPDCYLFNEVLGWYALQHNNAWRHYDKQTPSGLKRQIADTFQTLTMDTKRAIMTKHAKESATITDNDKQKELTKALMKTIDTIHRAYKMFGSSEFCNGVIAFLPSCYDDPDLEEKMDMNRYVFAFTDGLYDLNECKFRPIRPSDMVSTTTNYPYPKQSNQDARLQINEFLRGLFENDAVTQYLLKVLSSCLLGYNRWEEFYVFTGSGGNGKGVISELLTYVFGQHYLTVENSLFTKARDRTDQPIPALVEARSKRIMMTTEPETADTLKVGLLKKISGGDPIEARTLHSKHIVKYKPLFKVFFQTNDIPALSKTDGGISRRMKIINFPFKFVSNPTAPMERQGNPDVKERLCKSAEWRDEFMLLLTEIWATKVKNLSSLEIPNAVAESTSAYLDENNPIKHWLAERYDVTKSDRDFISQKELKQQYINDCNVSDKVDDRWFKNMLSFNGILHKHTGRGNGFIGLKRKVMNDEE